MTDFSAPAPLDDPHSIFVHRAARGTRMVSGQLFSHGEHRLAFRRQSRRKSGNRVDERLRLLVATQASRVANAPDLESV